MSIFSWFDKKPLAGAKASDQKGIYQKLKNIQVDNDVNTNSAFIDEIFDGNNSIVRRNLVMGFQRIKILLIYMCGMVNEKLLADNIVKPILDTKDLEIDNRDICNEYFREKIITSGEVREAVTYDVLIYEVLSGSAVVFADGCNTAFIVSVREKTGRNVEKADTEQSIRGAKEAFIENLNANIVLIRNKIKSPDLSIEIINIGERSRTNIAVAYLKGVINKELPSAIKKRISEIRIDGIVDSSQIQALVQKHKWTILPQMVATERVDRITSAILEGRAAVIVEGTPFVLIIPTTFSLFLNTPDDNYGRSIVTSILKIIRYIGFFEACSISALYLALTTHHPGLLPTSLALSITGTRVGLPFPVALEIIIMEVTLYLIQEAALRLPKAVGQTVGIVGGLVIGQAVVQAGIVSPIIVIIVSMSAIASFTLPNYTFALSTIAIRLFLISCSALFGLYGFVMGAISLLIHAASLENFGVKYMADYSPLKKDHLKETIIAAPLHTIHNRPEYLEPEDIKKSEPERKAGSDG